MQSLHNVNGNPEIKRLSENFLLAIFFFQSLLCFNLSPKPLEEFKMRCLEKANKTFFQTFLARIHQKSLLLLEGQASLAFASFCRQFFATFAKNILVHPSRLHPKVCLGGRRNLRGGTNSQIAAFCAFAKTSPFQISAFKRQDDICSKFDRSWGGSSTENLIVLYGRNLQTCHCSFFGEKDISNPYF